MTLPSITELFRQRARWTASEEELGPALEALIAGARAAHPGLELPLEDFVPFVAERVESLSGLSTLAAGDLYLVCACVRGDARALQTLESAQLPHVQSFLRRRRLSADQMDEVVALLRERLLLGSEHTPAKLLSYRGQSPLLVWLQIVALRLAQRLLRSVPPRIDAEEGLELVTAAADPERRYLQAEGGRELQAAMETTLRALDENERAVLRLYFVEDLTIEQIAELYRVHHSTVSRWISKCRKSVLAETRRLLKERLALREDQVSSLVRAVRSQLDLSIGRLLTASPG